MKGYSSGRHSLAEAAARCQAKGYEWVALELDDDETGAYNRSIYPQFLTAFRARGMKAGCWWTAGGSLYLTPPDSDFAIAECEGPGDYEGISNVIAWGQLPHCPLAIVTNFNVPLVNRAAARPLIDAGFSCLTEAYLNENPEADPDGLDRIARDLGWPTSQPVAGVYPVGGEPVPDYSPWASWPMADYLGEYVL